MRELSGKKVVIVAGPSASGKSYLIRQLTTKRKSHFRDQIYHQLGINPQEPRSHISIGALTKLENNSKPGHTRKLIKELIFHPFRYNQSPSERQTTPAPINRDQLQKHQSRHPQDNL